MPWMGFESTIPMFERAKAFHAPDRAVIVIGRQECTDHKNMFFSIQKSTKRVFTVQ
jgi:hypothetical protein